MNEIGYGEFASMDQLVCTVVHDSDVIGYVVIDSMVAGRSRGGLRLRADISEEEMRAVARSMTLKYGFLGLPQGGAKAGVRGEPEGGQVARRQLLERFGRAIAPLLRNSIYIPDTDMGTTNADIQHLLDSVGIRTKRRELRGANSGYYTALTVMAGARQATACLGIGLAGATAAIEGFGKVGSALAELLVAAKVRLVAVSTSHGAIFQPAGLNLAKLQELSAREGSRVVELYREANRIDPGAMLELPVDLLCPCARHNRLNIDNAARIKARIICAGANNAVTPAAERILFERGVLCMPDFVTNCGGVLGGTMEFASVDRARIEEFIDRHIGDRIAWMLAEARRKGSVPREIALAIAKKRFDQVCSAAMQPSPLKRVFSLGLEFYRRGWVPGQFVAALALPYFKRCLA
jgi:glutamate dehydrogenase/leucine dehydrogenase